MRRRHAARLRVRAEHPQQLAGRGDVHPVPAGVRGVLHGDRLPAVPGHVPRRERAVADAAAGEPLARQVQVVGQPLRERPRPCGRDVDAVQRLVEADDPAGLHLVEERHQGLRLGLGAGGRAGLVVPVEVAPVVRVVAVQVHAVRVLAGVPGQAVGVHDRDQPQVDALDRAAVADRREDPAGARLVAVHGRHRDDLVRRLRVAHAVGHDRPPGDAVADHLRLDDGRPAGDGVRRGLGGHRGGRGETPADQPDGADQQGQGAAAHGIRRACRGRGRP